MTNLVIALSVALGIAGWALFRLYRKHLIIRHLFIDFTDWSANKIDRMELDAVENMAGLLQEVQPENYSSYDEAVEHARGIFYGDVIHAKSEWARRVDWLQAMLKHNNCARLDLNDKDIPVLSPWVSGIRYLPGPQ